MNIISPALNFGFHTLLCKKIFIHPLLTGGYAFISYRGTDPNGNAGPEFKEQGTFIQSSFFVGYLTGKKISVGFNGSYKIIFQHFGNNATLEENTIRMADFGIGLTYNLL